MANSTKKYKSNGFIVGLKAVYNTRTANEYFRCLAEVREVCTTTEETANSLSSFYNKMHGRAAVTTAEAERLAAVFARYGVSEWR